MKKVYLCLETPTEIQFSIQMLKRTAAISNFLAMMMVLITTIAPHHHHQAMVYFAREVCVADGCCNDEHTSHSEADPDDNESHCIAHEGYFQTDILRQDGIAAVFGPVSIIPTPLDTFVKTAGAPCRIVRSFTTLSILSWHINC